MDRYHPVRLPPSPTGRVDAATTQPASRSGSPYLPPNNSASSQLPLPDHKHFRTWPATAFSTRRADERLNLAGNESRCVLVRSRSATINWIWTRSLSRRAPHPLIHQTRTSSSHSPPTRHLPPPDPRETWASTTTRLQGRMDNPLLPQALWESAAAAISRILQFSSEFYLEVPISVLVRLLHSGSERTVIGALNALLVLKSDDGTSAEAMAENGALGALVELLRFHQCEDTAARLLEVFYDAEINNLSSTIYAFQEAVTSNGVSVEDANAADLIQRRQRPDFLSSIKGTLATSIKENQDIIPPLLTLALNDALTYDKATKTGGPNGLIRFSSEIERPENKGLSAALSFIETAKKEIDSYSKGGPIGFADLIQLAAQSAVKATFLAAAIRKCGGNVEKGSLLYTAYGSTGQWGQFDKIFWRTDADEPDLEGRIPQWDKAIVQEMKDKFSAVGLGPRQVDLITTLTKVGSLGQTINYEAYTYPVMKVDLSKLKL
ncbi:Thylakoid lumenal 29 kDa protein, chloroplastic-like protein [Drosera capensis]